jgi:hypothetical protein
VLAAGFVIVVLSGAPTVTAAAARPASPASAVVVPITMFLLAIVLPFLVCPSEVIVGGAGKQTRSAG